MVGGEQELLDLGGRDGWRGTRVVGKVLSAALAPAREGWLGGLAQAAGSRACGREMLFLSALRE